MDTLTSMERSGREWKESVNFLSRHCKNAPNTVIGTAIFIVQKLCYIQSLSLTEVADIIKPIPLLKNLNYLAI